MNKNTRARLREYRKECKKSGRWMTGGFKAKKKKFPSPFQKKNQED